VRGLFQEACPLSPRGVSEAGREIGQRPATLKAIATEGLEVRRIMLTPVAGEITEREPSNGHLIFQGGIPEVEEFISTIKR
jgi:hypothetical protein